MRIVTWNVNSIRSRGTRIFGWVDRHQPDVVLLQETKCTDELFDADYRPRFVDRGYEVAHHGVDHWNGVAIASRVGLDQVERGFPHSATPYDEARVIRAVCADTQVYSVYVPNGRELDDPHYLYKLVWLERLRSLIGAPAPGARVVVAGDFNVAPRDDDIYDPVRWRRRTHASAPERAGIDHLVELGLTDVTRMMLPDPGVYTWWSYRPGQFEKNQGLRIDLALVSDEIAAVTERVWIDTGERADDRDDEKPSDHAPLVLDTSE